MVLSVLAPSWCMVTPCFRPPALQVALIQVFVIVAFLGHLSLNPCADFFQTCHGLPQELWHMWFLRCGKAHDGDGSCRTYDGSDPHWLAWKRKKQERLVSRRSGTLLSDESHWWDSQVRLTARRWDSQMRLLTGRQKARAMAEDKGSFASWHQRNSKILRAL